MSRKEALKTATSNAAEALGLEKKLSSLSISKGKLGDLIVVSGNPLENISVLRKIEAVFRKGKRLV